jgi:pyruvate dehydrogenase E1 component
MWGQGQDVFHYVMLYNQNEQQPAKPAGIDADLIRGAYRMSEASAGDGPMVRLLGSGPILSHVQEAAEMLSGRGVRAEIWSVPSYGELRRAGLASERATRLDPQNPQSAFVTECFGDEMTTVAASDYIAAVPEMIQRWVGGRYVVLGTDGYGRSDTRDSLRRFFEIDTASIVVAALSALEQDGSLDAGTTTAAAKELGVASTRYDKTE